MNSPIKKEPTQVYKDLLPVTKARELTVPKPCGKICLKISEFHLLAGSTIVNTVDFSVFKDLEIKEEVTAAHFHQESKQLYVSTTSGTFVYSYPKFELEESKLDELKSINSFAPFITNGSYLVFSSPTSSIGVINTSIK